MTDDSEVLDGRADDVVEQQDLLSQMAVAQLLNVLDKRTGGNQVLLELRVYQATLPQFPFAGGAILRF